MLGANKEKMAKVIRLSVVKNPASPLDIPRSSRINGINGPTEAMEVRRLIEIRITPRIRKALEEDLDKGGFKSTKYGFAEGLDFYNKNVPSTMYKV